MHLNTVISLLKKYGNNDYSVITVSQTTDPSDPTNVVNTEISDNIQSYAGSFKTKDIDGDLIRSSDIKLYVDPETLSSVPDTNKKVTDGSKTYSIKNIKRYKSGDTVVLYIFQLRE